MWFVLYVYKWTSSWSDRLVTTCQLHMRKFNDGDTIFIEPFRAKTIFLLLRIWLLIGLAFDRIQHAGGYISVNTSGNTQDANAIPVEKMLIKHLMLQHVLDVLHALLLVKMPRQCCLCLLKYRSTHYFLKEKLKPQIGC